MQGVCNLTPLDALYLQRAYELAARAIGSTAPNPPVGAVVVRNGQVVSEGYHHYAGAPHAEAIALQRAGAAARGATVYISLEPCRHVGRTPPCTLALIDSGVARVVAGTLDPTGHGGAAELRECGIPVTIAGDRLAEALVEPFVHAQSGDRPYMAVKMAMSLDGAVASRPAARERISSDAEQDYVRDLRTAYDAVMVGAGTVRVDDPQLTVRPAHDRLRPYVRIVVCQTDSVSPSSQVLRAHPGYARTFVIAPSRLQARLHALEDIGDVLYVGDPDSVTLDLSLAMKTLRARGVYSILCEGGPRLAAALIAASLVDRIYWAIAPVFLSNDRAVPVLRGADLAAGNARLIFDRIERAGDDVIISAKTCPERVQRVEGCSAG